MEFPAAELADAEKPPVLRAYLNGWLSIASKITTISSPDAGEVELAKAAPQYPVLVLD